MGFRVWVWAYRVQQLGSCFGVEVTWSGRFCLMSTASTLVLWLCVAPRKKVRSFLIACCTQQAKQTYPVVEIVTSRFKKLPCSVPTRSKTQTLSAKPLNQKDQTLRPSDKLCRIKGVEFRAQSFKMPQGLLSSFPKQGDPNVDPKIL